MDSNLKLLQIMVEAQLPYVLNRIDGKNNKKVYKNTLNLFTNVHILSHYESFINYTTYFNRQSVEIQLFRIPRDWFGYKGKYRNLALAHIKDIINSINIRFVKGVRADDVR